MPDISNIQIESGIYNIKDKIAREKIKKIENKTFYFTPEMYGAIGDGITDDYLAFEKMINDINNIVPNIDFINESSCKDYSHISIKFTQKYLITKPLIFSNCYGLNIENLHLIAGENFIGDSLFILNNISREINILNCIFNGNFYVNNCFTLQDYSLIIRINNSQFTRFKKFGFYATSKGHEIIMNNCKIKNGKYIYNPKQADFLVDMKCTFIKTGIHSKTKCQYWVFEINESLNIAMKIWKQRKINVATGLQR